MPGKYTAFTPVRSWTEARFLPGDFTGFRTRNLVRAAFPSGAFAVKAAGRPAVLASPELPALFPFDQLLLSANVMFPSGGSFCMEASVRIARGWSPWFSWGTFSPGKGASAPVSQNAFGKMDTDILRLSKKATAYRYRLTVRTIGSKPAVIRLAAACYTDSALPCPPSPPARRAPAVKLELPKRSQMALRAEHSRDICSPVSLSMVLAGLGLDAPPLATAAAARDYGAEIYGNWHFNTAYAGTRGLYAVLARLNTLDEARAFIEAGIPVIASLTFGRGELPGSPIPKTTGHLLVITGFTALGDVIVNDPAAHTTAAVERVYKRACFEKAWLTNKYGLSYLVARDLGRFLRVKAPFAELYSAPPGGGVPKTKVIETQLLFNERAELLELSGRWARVRAPEQACLGSDGRTLLPYEGWVEASSLAFGLPLPANAVIRSKTARSAGKGFSMGVKLTVCAAGALPAGRLPAGSLNALQNKFTAAELRRKVLRAARLFLGDRYYWGGRSAWGVDCSGLVNLVFRAWGAELPRNAGDQFFASRGVKPGDLKPGDLIFSSDASAPADITHVMLYAGAGRLVEATGDTGSVREATFRGKFGIPFRAAACGMTARGRKIFFRRIIGPT